MMSSGRTIGIPQAFGYYYFHALWKTFFSELGFDVVTSGPTNRRKLDAGIQIAPSEACLPLKCYLGHLIALLKDEADWAFVPRLVCLKRTPEIRLGCPKFIGLPDMARALLPDARIVTLDVDLRKEEEPRSYLRLAEQFDKSPAEGAVAYEKGLAELKRHREEIWKKPRSPSPNLNGKLTIGVLGHAYLLEDNYLNLNLVKRLEGLGCEVLSGHELPSEELERELGCFKSLSWYFEEEILAGASSFFHRQKVSGIVYLVSFGCGAGSITHEVMDLEVRGDSRVPLLRIVLDEHTGEAGLMTRLESFVDMIKLRKAGRL